MPAFDIALVNAGDRSGRLDACFKLLAGYYEERSKMARKMIADLQYPVFLFHFAVVVFAFIDFLQAGHGVTRFCIPRPGDTASHLCGRGFSDFCRAGAARGKMAQRGGKRFSGGFRCWARRGAAWPWRGWRRHWRRCSTRGSSLPGPGNWRWRRAVRPPWGGPCAAGRRRWNPAPRRRSWSRLAGVSRIVRQPLRDG